MESKSEEVVAQEVKPLPTKVDAIHLRKVREASQKLNEASQKLNEAAAQVKAWRENQLVAQGELNANEALIAELFVVGNGDKVEEDGTIVRKA